MQIHNSFSFVTALRLKQLREEKGLSHQKLSEALSEQFDVTISRDSLMNYEVATPNHSSSYKNLGMRIEYLHALASFYGVSSDYLLGLTDTKSPFTDTRAVISHTGLTEENIRKLEYMQSVPLTYSLDFANDMLSFAHKTDVILPYIHMKATLSVPEPAQWSGFDFTELSDVEALVFGGVSRQYGYIQLTGEEAFDYFCSRLTEEIKKGLISQYKPTAKWNEHNEDA